MGQKAGGWVGAWGWGWEGQAGIIQGYKATLGGYVHYLDWGHDFVDLCLYLDLSSYTLQKCTLY